MKVDLDYDMHGSNRTIRLTVPHPSVYDLFQDFVECQLGEHVIVGNFVIKRDLILTIREVKDEASGQADAEKISDLMQCPQSACRTNGLFR